MQGEEQSLAASSQQTSHEPLTDDDKDWIACTFIHGTVKFPDYICGALDYAPVYPDGSAVSQSPRGIDDGDVYIFIEHMHRPEFPKEYAIYCRWIDLKTEPGADDSAAENELRLLKARYKKLYDDGWPGYRSANPPLHERNDDDSSEAESI
ncbi:MAG: hypothetical protein Q9186_007056 [Xanthomendoza sp. 1 TL-2023]